MLGVEAVKPRTINGRWTVMLPDHVADHPFLDDHERARFNSMSINLNPGDVVYDIGAEHGWSSAVIASIVGPENVVLVEGDVMFWTNLLLVWEANNWPMPRRCWPWRVDAPEARLAGLVEIPHRLAGPFTDRWPSSDGPEVGPKAYQQTRIATTVDAMAGYDPPAALSIDVEGAEAKVLAGASWTLANHRPLVWVSMHSDAMLAAHDSTPDDVLRPFRDADYQVELLDVDHEQHWFARPR